MTCKFKKLRVSIFIAGFLFFICISPVFAGNIDATSKYAWGNVLGWINFGTASGNVTVTDTGITGYAWSENYGWINMNTQSSGVDNTVTGDLSGEAWGEDAGYINFSEVTIDASGRFRGQASGTIAGIINFDCSNCVVKSSWQPRTLGSGLPGNPVGAYSGPTIMINYSATSTWSPAVVLAFNAPPDTSKMQVSNFPDFHDAPQIPFTPLKSWNLCWEFGAVRENCSPGFYQVYARFYPPTGNPFPEASANILLNTAGFIQKTVEKVEEFVKDIFEPFIPGFLKPKPEPNTSQNTSPSNEGVVGENPASGLIPSSTAQQKPAPISHIEEEKRHAYDSLIDLWWLPLLLILLTTLIYRLYRHAHKAAFASPPPPPF